MLRLIERKNDRQTTPRAIFLMNGNKNIHKIQTRNLECICLRSPDNRVKQRLNLKQTNQCNEPYIKRYIS